LCRGQGVEKFNIKVSRKSFNKEILRRTTGKNSAPLPLRAPQSHFQLNKLWIAAKLRICLQDITLAEALCGTSFTIRHLDDRTLKVTSAPGEVITPDSWKCINDEGMPEHGRPYEHGNMYIQFHVKFPETLSASQVDELQKILGGSSASLPEPPAGAPPTSNGDVDMAEGEGEHIEEVSCFHPLRQILSLACLIA
jgi:hypothetical protein